MPALVSDPANPNRLKIVSGGACISLIGFVAFALGLLVAGARYILPAVEFTITGQIVASAFLLLMGSLFLFLRSPSTLDRRRRVIRDETTFLFIPMKSKETSFDVFSEVVITKEVTQSQKSSHTIYPVRLKGRETRDFEHPRVYEDARRTGERLAQFMELPLIDSSSGVPVRREFDQLNESLADQLRREGIEIGVPPEPPGSGVTVTESRSELRLELPKGGINMMHLLMLVIVPLFVLPGLMPMFLIGRSGKAGPPAVFLLVAGLFVLIPIIIVVGIVLKNLPAPQTVVIGRKTTTIQERRPVFGKRISIATDEVEELVDLEPSSHSPRHPLARLVPAPGLAFRTDKATVVFAGGLGQVTKDYLAARIKRFLMEQG